MNNKILYAAVFFTSLGIIVLGAIINSMEIIITTGLIGIMYFTYNISLTLHDKLK